MTDQADLPEAPRERVLIPGGTGGVGEGIVRAWLATGADVVVPTRSDERAAQFRSVLGAAATERLHLFVHDYTTFAGAEELVRQMTDRLGGIDHVVAPIGGWWSGRGLREIDEHDWQRAFVDLSTAHMAVARAAVPLLPKTGTYTVVVGASATWPVPGSGLVSMEQAAVLMLHRVLAAEESGGARTFALVLGPVDTRNAEGGAGQITADQVGRIARSLAADPSRPSGTVDLTTPGELATTLDLADAR